MFRNLLLGALALAAVPAGAQTTVNWQFDGAFHGNGQLTYGSDGVVTAFSGTYAGQTLSLVTFTTDPNNPGAQLGHYEGGTPEQYNYHNIPNTGGADLGFDNQFPLTTFGILLSTGRGDDAPDYTGERILDIGLTNGIPDFFEFTTGGQYRDDFGTFTTTAAVAVPEPASWALMILGMGAVGHVLRRRLRASEIAFDAKIKRMSEGALG